MEIAKETMRHNISRSKGVIYPVSGKELMKDLSESQKKKEYLLSYIPLAKEVKNLEEQINSFCQSKISPKNQKYDKSVTASGELHDLSDVIIQESSLVDRWIKVRKKKVEKCSEIYCQICLLENETEKTVLQMHYLRKLKWDEIAERLGVSERHIYRIHGAALKHFELPREETDDGEFRCRSD